MMVFVRPDPRPCRGDRAGSLRWLAAPGAVLAFVLGCAPAALGETCLEQTQQLADRYDMSIKPPAAEAGRETDGATSGELAESGGVIVPPPARDPAVIEAPQNGRDAMPTVPDIEPQKPPPQPRGSDGLDPSARTTLQAILMAAGAEARRGKEENCFEQLSKAKAYIARQRG